MDSGTHPVWQNSVELEQFWRRREISIIIIIINDYAKEHFDSIVQCRYTEYKGRVLHSNRHLI